MIKYYQDQIELYQEKEHIMTLKPEQQTVLQTVMGCSWPMHNITWYLYLYCNIES